MKTIGIVLGICLFVYISYRIYGMVTLDQGLKDKVRNGAVILDVRTEREFKTGHINGALNIPLSRLHASRIPLDKNKTYITVCSHGLRSVKAMNLLRGKGYPTVYNGGAWADLEKALQ